MLTQTINLKRYKVYNLFSLQKIFIVNNFSRVYLQKNAIYTNTNVLLRSVLLVTKLFKIKDYYKIFSFFFFSFVQSQKVILCSFKLFFFDFLNFMSYIYDIGFYFYYKPLLEFYQEKRNRKKFLVLIHYI
jgi:hypothetical protein